MWGDPKEQQSERDDLDLDAEMVKDLDVDETDAGQVAGGSNSASTGYSAPRPSMAPG